MTNINETIIEKGVAEAAFERECFLGDTINAFIEKIGVETNGIQFQIYSPAHGLTYEDMQILVRAINYEWLLSSPESGKREAVYYLAHYAKEQGENIPDVLLGKLAEFNETEDDEISYRLYAFGSMKKILIDHIKQL